MLGFSLAAFCEGIGGGGIEPDVEADTELWADDLVSPRAPDAKSPLLCALPSLVLG